MLLPWEHVVVLLLELVVLLDEDEDELLLDEGEVVVAAVPPEPQPVSVARPAKPISFTARRREEARTIASISGGNTPIRRC